MEMEEDRPKDSVGLSALSLRGTGSCAWSQGLTAVIAVIAVLLLWLYLPMLSGLIRQWWDDPDYSHGFLVPLMSAYFIWDRRESLRKIAETPSRWPGLVVLIVGVGLLLLGGVAAEIFTMRISLLVVLAGLTLHLFGKHHLKALALPILYLVFMIPPPAIIFNSITFPLQLFAARTATGTLQLLDIPVLREGNVIVLANTTLEVAEACSGIRSLVTLFALAAALAYFTQRKFWRAGVLVLSAVPIAIAANASRVAGTGVLAHLYGPKVAEGFFHTLSGWFLFLVASFLLGLVGTALAKITPRVQSSTATPARLDRESPSLSSAGAHRLAGWHVLSAAAILAAGILSLHLLSHGEAIPLRQPLAQFPAQLGAWQGTADKLSADVLDILRVSDYTARLYTAPGKLPIGLYVGYYETQRQGQEIHSPQQCLPGGGWSILSRRNLTIAVPGQGQPVTINNVLVANGAERMVVLYWYQERGRIIASEYTSKLYMIEDAILRNRTDGALVRLTARVRGSQEQTLEELVDFARLAFPVLSTFLPG